MEPIEAPLKEGPIGPDITFLRLNEVLAICGMSRSSVYEAIKEEKFPAPVKLGVRSAGWVKSEVIAWANARITASRSK